MYLYYYWIVLRYFFLFGLLPVSVLDLFIMHFYLSLWLTLSIRVSFLWFSFSFLFPWLLFFVLSEKNNNKNYLQRKLFTRALSLCFFIPTNLKRRPWDDVVWKWEGEGRGNMVTMDTVVYWTEKNDKIGTH